MKQLISPVLMIKRLAIKQLALAAVCLLMMVNAQAGAVRHFDIASVDDKQWWLRAYDDSTVNVLAGADITALHAYDRAQVNLYGGKVDYLKAFADTSITVNGGSVASLSLWNDSKATINAGKVSSLWTLGNSTVRINEIEQLNTLYVLGNSEIILNAADFRLDGKMLTGHWASGRAFNIRTINLSGSGTVLNHISAVPLPTSGWLFLSAVLGLGLLGRRRALHLYD